MTEHYLPTYVLPAPGPLTPVATSTQGDGRVLPSLGTDVWKLGQTQKSDERELDPVGSLLILRYLMHTPLHSVRRVWVRWLVLR